MIVPKEHNYVKKLPFEPQKALEETVIQYFYTIIQLTKNIFVKVEDRGNTKVNRIHESLIWRLISDSGFRTTCGIRSQSRAIFLSSFI